MSLHDAVIIDALRTPIGKYGGALRDVRPDDLAAHVIRAVLERAGIDPVFVEEIYWGAANQSGEDNRNVARMAGLLAGLPVEVAGATVNRLCGSGLQAIVSAAREIQVGAVEIAIAGGSESMTRAPLVMLKQESAFGRGNATMYDTTLGWRMMNPNLAEMYPPISLGETAEKVAKQYGISREDQDAFALRSHRRAVAAQDSSRFSREIVPVDTPLPKGQTASFDRDEGPRRDTSAEKLGQLRPAFAADGTVTAGNSSQLNDGAAALVLMSASRARELGIKPLGRFVDAASVGVDPSLMGIGPVPATRKLLRRTGIEIHDVDVVELNEAFASQVLACARELCIDVEKLNPNGGAIAIGHPLGASGARLATTLLYELQRRDGRYGMVTMCIGVGQGISALFERMES